MGAQAGTREFTECGMNITVDAKYHDRTVLAESNGSVVRICVQGAVIAVKHDLVKSDNKS